MMNSLRLFFLANWPRKGGALDDAESNALYTIFSIMLKTEGNLIIECFINYLINISIFKMLTNGNVFKFDVRTFQPVMLARRLEDAGFCWRAAIFT